MGHHAPSNACGPGQHASRAFGCLLQHFFSLRLHGGAHLSACISFVAAQSSNVVLKAGKKVDNFRHRWVLMCLKDANPRPEEMKGLPEKTSAWSSVKLSDLWVVPMLERFSRDISAKKLTGGMIVKEFLVQRLAPLHAHSRPLWEYWDGDDELRLWPRDLPAEDLSRVRVILLGGDPGDLLQPFGPQYRRDDQTDLVAVMPIFNERGLLPAEGSGPVEVSSGVTFAEGGSEKTIDDRTVSVPLLSQYVLLCELEDDGATDDTFVGTPLHPARASTGLVPSSPPSVGAPFPPRSPRE
ncbi:hypothetical protein ZWY2020_051023 [Hordeum vulgare]|nr:hypothetical protein ZWY2020_051023 [Hordeum vulgare]